MEEKTSIMKRIPFKRTGRGDEQVGVPLHELDGDAAWAYTNNKGGRSLIARFGLSLWDRGSRG